MIRIKDKILGEPNHPNTVTASGALEAGKLVIGSGNKGIQTLDLNPNVILYSNSVGDLQQLSFANQTNKVVGTDADGNLALIDKPKGSGSTYRITSDTFKIVKFGSTTAIANGYTNTASSTTGTILNEFYLSSIPTGTVISGRTGYGYIKFAEPYVVTGGPKTVLVTAMVSVQNMSDVEYEDPNFVGKIAALRLMTSSYENFNGVGDSVSLNSKSIHNTAWRNIEMVLAAGTYYGLGFEMIFNTTSSNGQNYLPGAYKLGCTLTMTEVT